MPKEKKAKTKKTKTEPVAFPKIDPIVETPEIVVEKPISAVDKLFIILTEAKMSLDNAVREMETRKRIYEEMADSALKDRKMLADKMDEIREIEKKLNDKLDYSNYENTYQKLKQDSARIKHELEIEQSKWEQKKIDYLRERERQEQDMQNRLQLVKDGEVKLNNAIRDFNKLKDKYGIIDH